jgi:hypothetical protein
MLPLLLLFWRLCSLVLPAARRVMSRSAFKLMSSVAMTGLPSIRMRPALAVAGAVVPSGLGLGFLAVTFTLSALTLVPTWVWVSVTVRWVVVLLLFALGARSGRALVGQLCN